MLFRSVHMWTPESTVSTARLFVLVKCEGVCFLILFQQASAEHDIGSIQYNWENDMPQIIIQTMGLIKVLNKMWQKGWQSFFALMYH